jgi:hypothetical protein
MQAPRDLAIACRVPLRIDLESFVGFDFAELFYQGLNMAPRAILTIALSALSPTNGVAAHRLSIHSLDVF